MAARPESVVEAFASNAMGKTLKHRVHEKLIDAEE